MTSFAITVLTILALTLSAQIKSRRIIGVGKLRSALWLASLTICGMGNYFVSQFSPTLEQILTIDALGFFLVLVAIAVTRLGMKNALTNSLPRRNPFPLLVLNVSGEVVFRNAEAMKFLASQGVLHPEVLAIIQPIARRVSAENTKHQMEICHAGQVYFVTAVPGLVRELVNLYLQDITTYAMTKEELTVAQLRAQAAESMAALGELAAGIGHEIANPLAVIVGNAHVLQSLEFAGNQEKCSSRIAALLHAASKIKAIVDNLHSMSRIGAQDPHGPVDVVAVAKDAASFVAHKFSRHKVALRTSGLDVPLVLHGSEIQLFQTLVNLLSNGADAVAGTPEAWVELRCSASDTAIEIRCIDSGRGIAPEIRSRIFDPLFTTKPKGQGTGLGLSLVRRMVTANQGTISIDENAPNTTFVVTLPRQKKQIVDHDQAA